MEVDSSFDFPLNYFDFIAENLFPSLKENEAERTSNGYMVWIHLCNELSTSWMLFYFYQMHIN
jgi:hypothetical protein